MADEAHDQIRAHRDRCRRVWTECGTAEEELNECLGRMDQLIRDTAVAPHALSCGTADGDTNEVKYLQEALNMIEDFQRRGARREVAQLALKQCC